MAGISLGWAVEVVEDLVTLGVLAIGVAVGRSFVPRGWRVLAGVSVAATVGMVLWGTVPGLTSTALVAHEVVVIGVIVSSAVVMWLRHRSAVSSDRSGVRERAKVTALLDAAPGLLVVSDPRGAIVEVNAEVVRLLGRTRDELVEMRWSEAFGISADDPRIGDFLQWIADGCPGEPMVEYAVPTAFGLRWIAWHRRATRGADRAVSYIVSGGVDITDRHEREAVLRARGQELEAMAAERGQDLQSALEELQSAIESRELFFAGASHELRSPLTSVIGFSGVLLSGAAGELNGEQEKQVRMIRDSGETLLRLVNDLLEVSSSRGGRLTAEPQEVELSSIVAAVARDYAGPARLKHLRLVVLCPIEPVPAFTDGVRFHQVVENLVSNAIKYTESGSVTVELECVPQATCETVIVRVTDTGRGLDQADVADVFEPFRRFRRGADSAQRGNGLGLWVSRRVTRLLGGDIDVTSERGVGSTFTAWFARRLDASPGEVLELEQAGAGLSE